MVTVAKLGKTFVNRRNRVKETSDEEVEVEPAHGPRHAAQPNPSKQGGGSSIRLPTQPCAVSTSQHHTRYEILHFRKKEGRGGSAQVGSVTSMLRDVLVSPLKWRLRGEKDIG